MPTYYIYMYGEHIFPLPKGRQDSERVLMSVACRQLLTAKDYID